MKFSFRYLILVAVICLIAIEVRAENLVSFEIQGEITGVNHLFVDPADMAVGDHFVVILTYDLDVTPTSMEENHAIYNDLAPAGFSATIIETGLTFEPNIQIPTDFRIDVYNDNFSSDAFLATNRFLVPERLPTQVVYLKGVVGIADPTGTVFDGLSLPTNLEDFQQHLPSEDALFAIQGNTQVQKIQVAFGFVTSIRRVLEEPDTAIENLIEELGTINFTNGTSNSMESKLENALDAWMADNAEQRNDAVNKMESFIKSVNAQRGKNLSNEDADFLIAQARKIIDLMLSD